MKLASSFLAFALAVGRLVAAAPAVDVAGAINATFCGDICSPFSVTPGDCTATNVENMENVTITPPEVQCQLFIGSQCQGDHIAVEGSVKGSVPIRSEYSSIGSIDCTPTA